MTAQHAEIPQKASHFWAGHILQRLWGLSGGAGIAGLWKRGAAFELERKTAKRIGRKRETKRDTRSPDQREREDLLNKTLQKLLRRHAKGCYVIFLPKKHFPPTYFYHKARSPFFYPIENFANWFHHFFYSSLIIIILFFAGTKKNSPSFQFFYPCSFGCIEYKISLRHFFLS